MRDRFDAAQRPHLACRIDPQRSQQREVVDVDSEDDVLVVLHDELRCRLRIGIGDVFSFFVEADRCVQNNVQVVPFLANLLDLTIDIVR